MDTITINRILQNLPPDERRRTHEAFDEARRMDAHFDEEVLSEDPEIGLEHINGGGESTIDELLEIELAPIGTVDIIAQELDASGFGDIYSRDEIEAEILASHDMHEPDDLPFSDVDPEEMMLREMGVYDD